MPSSRIEAFRSTRERLRQQLVAGASGLSVARALSDAADDLIRSAWDGPDDAAVVAVGGYGRRQLCLFSDIDLIVLHPRNVDVVPAAKQLSYELYDSGTELGFGVHTPKEAQKLAASRFDVEASLRDARLIAGDPATLGQLSEQLASMKGFERRLADAVLGWRAAGGDAGAELEPDLKEGKGGLRDLVAMGWLSMPEPEGATDTIVTSRQWLHHVTGRRTDRLLMQLQAQVAEGMRPDLVSEYPPLQTPEEELLRLIYVTCRRVARALDAALGWIRQDQGSWSTDVPWPEQQLSRFLAMVRELHDDPAGSWSGVDQGLLEALPEWKNVHCLPQRNVYHRFAVDVHSAEVAKQVQGLTLHPDALTAKVAAESAGDMDVLLMAALFHDIGKGTDADHSQRGAAIARDAMARMGVPPSWAEDVEWLVGNHLALSETATRRDIGDEAIVIEIAELVGDERRLRMLYLLSVADGLATGPAAWSRWKSTLVARLFSRVAHVIEEGTLVGSDISQEAHRVREELRHALSDHPEHLVEQHLAGMPRAWLLSQPFEPLLRQSLAMLDPPLGDEVKVHAEPQTGAGIWEVVVIAGDRPGLFSKIAGVLALHGLSVLGAQIFTREDGIALEVFRVEEHGDEGRRFEAVAYDAVKALKGRLSLDLRLAEKGKDYAWKVPKGKQEPPQVIVDNKASDFYTVIEVHARDQVGLLYTITKSLTDMSCDIHIAKVSTYAEDVVDVFYVRDLQGQKIVDPDHAREIQMTILHRMGLTPS